MIGVIIASHGQFAPGIYHALTMILGEQSCVKVVNLLPEEGPDDIYAKMETAVASFEDQDNILIICDVWGGTPFNQANRLITGHEDKWAIVAGMNLPMIISAASEAEFADSAQELAASIFEDGKDGIQIYPESLTPEEAAPKAAAAAVAPTGAIPEGTVLGTGKIDIGLARIDTRLLHGQVATGWTKAVRPDRIIAVSDAVAHDDLRKHMIMEAAPPGVKAHCVPIQKMIDVSKDPRFGATRAMLLFETPQDALAAIEGGVEIEELNVGSMAHSLGKFAVNKVLSLDAKDVETFEKLKALGVKFDVRKVPGDSKENMDELLKKAKEGLGI